MLSGIRFKSISQQYLKLYKGLMTTKPVKVLHVVERIDDRYGGPAEVHPYTVWASQCDDLQHHIMSGRYTSSDQNTVWSVEFEL